MLTFVSMNRIMYMIIVEMREKHELRRQTIYREL